MSFHPPSVGLNNHAITANPNATGAGYTDIAEMLADTDFNTDAANIDKVVRVESPLGIFWLTASGTFIDLTSNAFNEFIELTDTFSDYSGLAGQLLQVNAGEDGIEAGQDFTITGAPTLGSLFLTSVTGALGLPPLTTIERDALSPNPGWEIFNETTLVGEMYNGTIWVTTGAVGANVSGTPLDNQVAVWNNSDTLEGNAGFVFNASTGDLGVGLSNPSTRVHVFEDTNNEGASAGITIEQDGTGDAALTFLLTGIEQWIFGIDNSDFDKFKIAHTNFSSPALTMDLNNNVGIAFAMPIRLSARLPKIVPPIFRESSPP